MKIKQLLIGKTNADQSDNLKLIKKNWPCIVGDSIASRSRPVKLMDNCLTVDTDGSSVRGEISFLSLAVLNRIKEKHNIRISDVKVR